MEQQRELVRLHDSRVDKLFAELHGLQTNLIARNEREFQLLYGNAPQETVVELPDVPLEEEYTTTVLDLAEDNFLLGLIDQPVGTPFPEE